MKIRLNRPLTTSRWTLPPPRAVLGVIMIVRNEAENLPNLFRSIANVADEVTVVDTGSTDATLDVCHAWGVRVVRQEWTDDFAAARNRAVCEATADYLLWLDADDRVPPDTQLRISALRDELAARGAPPRAFLFHVHNLDAAQRPIDTFVQTRIFPRLPGVEFRHRVHEEIVSSLLDAGVEIQQTGWSLLHTGYSSPAVNRQKALRNEGLLRRALEEEPDSVHHLLHWAQTLAVLGRVQEADDVLSRTLARAKEDNLRASFVAELYALRGTYRMHLGRELPAVLDLEAAIAAAPEWAVPYARLLNLQMDREQWDAAWDTVLASRQAKATPGVIGFSLQSTQKVLAVHEARLLVRRGDTSAASSRFADALALQPADIAVRLEWGQALLDAEDFHAARLVLEPMGEDQGAVDRIVDVCAAIGLARVMTGDHSAANACLAPLLDVFAADLGGAEDVNVIQLAEAMLRHGYGAAAKNMISLFQHTVDRAA